MPILKGLEWTFDTVTETYENEVPEMLEHSIAFDMQGACNILDGCYADTAEIGFNIHRDTRIIGCDFFNNKLMGLKKAIYDDVYENGQRADLPKSMEHIGCVTSQHTVKVDGKENIAALFSMTPYYWRTSESDKEKLSRLESLETEIEFEIHVYQK